MNVKKHKYIYKYYLYKKYSAQQKLHKLWFDTYLGILTNMKNIFKPFEGTESIKFGTPREAIRQSIESPYLEFTRNKFSKNSSDYYKELGIFLDYSTENICQAITFSDSSNLYHNDVNLISISYSYLRDTYDILSLDKNVEEEVGVLYLDLGFGVTKVYDENKVDAITIFSSDYYK